MTRLYGIQKVQLTDKDFKKCVDFSYRSAESQQSIEFGNHRTKARTTAELARDNLIGKLAEVAFSYVLHRTYGIQIDLDFNIYPRGIWDSDDLTLFGQPIDVKATRSGGRWLLVELNKLEFRKKENKLPFAFLFAVTAWNRDRDEYTGEVTLAGYSLLEQICHPDRIGVRNPTLCEGIPYTQFLREGDLIPGTNTRLQATNCARPVSQIERDWDKLIALAKAKAQGTWEKSIK